MRSSWTAGPVMPRAMQYTLAAFVFTCVLGQPHFGSAQISDDQLELDRGTAAFNSGRFEAALAAFDVSYRRKPAAGTLYQFAITYAAMGQPYKALEAYTTFLRTADPTGDSVKIDEATREIAHIKSAVGRFTLKVFPREASIEIDGHAAAVKDNELWLMPGVHSISIRAPGYESYAQTLESQSGRYSLEINLHANAAPAVEQATALVDDGMVLLSQGDLRLAISRFREAQAVFSTPRGLAQLGLAEQKSGDLASADEHISAALVATKDPYIRKNKQQLRKTLADIQRITRDYARLEISGAPPESQLYLGDRLVGILANLATLRVPPGRVLLIGRLDGYSDAVFEGELPPRGIKPVELRLEPLPPPPPPPSPPPPPPAAAPEPVAEAPVQEPAPAVEPPPGPSQAELDAMLREQAQIPEHVETATGFELNVSVGYQFWLSDGPWNSSGAPTLRMSLGVRLPWPLSFGVSLVDISSDFGSANTTALLTLSPGFYVRAHSQRERKAHVFDIWGGAGFVPFSMALASFKSSSTTEERLAGLDIYNIDTDEALTRLGIGRFVTRQSMNVPIELGATWYLTRGVGITLNAAYTLWLPQQVCYHNAGDHYCIDQNLKTGHSLFIGAGASFLP